MAIERVSETVAVGPRPGFVKTSVCSYVQYEGHRRHKAEVTFRPQLSPVKYSDTVYVYINSTKKRYVSRTFYQPRVKPKSYAETTYVCPKTKEEVFVTYLDQTPAENRKWFKTAVEIVPRRYTSAQTMPSPTDINSNSFSAVDQTLLDQRLVNGQRGQLPNEALLRRGAALPGYQNGVSGGGHEVQEMFDPGASQVYIPKRKDYTIQGDEGNLIDLGQQLTLDFSHSNNFSHSNDFSRSNGDLLINGDLDYSDV